MSNLHHGDIAEQIPDGLKVLVAGGAPMLSWLGLTVEEWSFILSAVVASLFIAEKVYKFIRWLITKEEDGNNCR